MSNIAKLKGKIAEKEMNQSQFAKAIGISRATISRKLQTGDFTIKEAERIVEVLNLNQEEAIDIFFSSIVA